MCRGRWVNRIVIFDQECGIEEDDELVLVWTYYGSPLQPLLWQIVRF